MIRAPTPIFKQTVIFILSSALKKIVRTVTFSHLFYRYPARKVPAALIPTTH
jgi:hypothetical protein